MDREKTMEGLEHCSDRSNMMCNRTCPYYDSIFCEAELSGDALALLKEQQKDIERLEETNAELENIILESQ